MPDLSTLDLNLLVTFEALWVERSVTKAGRRLNRSQPAMSGALARLRVMLGDRLFVRSSRGLEPTSRCHELAVPVQRALVELRNALAGQHFDPSTAARTFRLGAVDAAMAVVVPGLVRRVLAEAPNVRLDVRALDPMAATSALEAGALDLAICPALHPSASVRARALYPVEFVAVVRPGHPVSKRRPLSQFPRVHVAFGGTPRVEAAVQLGSFLAVPPLLASSDAWALLPKPFAAPLANEGQLEIVTTPTGAGLPAVRMSVLWPDAHDAAPASRWLRGLVLDATSHLRTP